MAKKTNEETTGQQGKSLNEELKAVEMTEDTSVADLMDALDNMAQAAAPMPPPIQPMGERVVLVEKAPTGYRPTYKKVGRNPKTKAGSPNTVTFFSQIKDLMLDQDGGFIQFKGHMYITDDKEDINFLMGHASYTNDYWKDDFPDFVLKKFEKDREYLTRSEEVFAVPEE